MKQKTMLLREQAEAVLLTQEYPTSSNTLVVKCPACRELLYHRDYERNHKVCTFCNYHFRLSTSERVQLLVDPGSFVPIDICGMTRDGSRSQPHKYTQQLKQEAQGLEWEEAVVAGYASIESHSCLLAITNAPFKEKRKGWLATEQVTCAIEIAIGHCLPVCTIATGLTLEEDICSRVQLAKITSALAMLAEARLPYISILADHVSGTAASFTLLGDVNLAEFSCLINFIYPPIHRKHDDRRSEQDGVPAEKLLQRGMLDALVPRSELRSTLARFLRFYAGSPFRSKPVREEERSSDPGERNRQEESTLD